MGSPYPWHYDLRWPFYHLRPSLRRRVQLPRVALVGGERGGELGGERRSREAACARVLTFGDLMGLSGDRVPRASRAVQELFARAELVIGNCEAPLTREHNDPRARYLMKLSLGADYLRDFFARFAVRGERCLFSVANNHAADYGDDGLRATEARLAALGVEAVGARGGAPELLRVREVGGLRVGVAAWTTWMNARFTSCTRERGVATAAHAAAFDGRAAREAHRLDTLLATPHWEWEFQHFPHAETVLAARGLAANGFDAIAGHHPHVLQPLALLGGNARSTLCAFSLGNLFARTLTWPHRLGGLLELQLATDGPRRGQVVGYELHPTVQVGEGAEVRVVSLREAPAALRDKLEGRLAELFAM